MKKLSLYMLPVLLFCGNATAESEDRNLKLDQLFEQLKKSTNVSMALEIEIKMPMLFDFHILC